MKLNRKIKMGMVGGGRGAFIGAVHRMAATLDNEIELVCGAFSSDPDKSRLSGADWHVCPERTYGSYQEMFAAERKLPVGERMDFVAIVTPNHTHYPIARAALTSGFHVMCDKPMTFSLAEAKKIRRRVLMAGGWQSPEAIESTADHHFPLPGGATLLWEERGGSEGEAAELVERAIQSTRGAPVQALDAVFG